MSKLILKGISSSVGFASGKAYVLKANSGAYYFLNGNINQDEEIERFNYGIKNYLSELEKNCELVDQYSTGVKALIYPIKQILSDQEISEQIIEQIKQGFSVEKSIDIVFDNYIEILKNTKKSISLKKAFELEQIKNRILALLSNSNISSEIPEGAIIVATSISPEQLLTFKNKNISGIVTEFSGLTTHSSILARSLKFPEIIGVTNATSLVHTGEYLLMDAYQGTIVVEPDKREIEKFKKKIAEENQIVLSLGKLADLATRTKDKHEIKLQVNINLFDDLNNPVVFYSDGVGLVRTELLVGQINKFIEKNDYTTLEEEQFKEYYFLSQKLYPKEVIFRFFDFGADKNSDLIKHYEKNPMLGLRGIRFLLAEERLFRTQVRALLRASALRNIKIMLPMVTNIEEIKESVQIIKECLLELINDGADVDTNIKIGVMIETPAAVLISDTIAEYVDFFSIGTNDLTQYTLAADRDNPRVAKYFDPFHPAVLKMMKITVDNAKAKNKPVGICGELASHPSATEILIGLGLDSISVTPNSFLQVKKWISNIEYNRSVEIVDKVLRMKTFEDIRQFLSIY